MSRTTLDPFEDRYARRMHGIRSSAMRDLMAIIQRPEVISLAGGLPDLSSITPEILTDLCTNLARTSKDAALQYGATEGTASAKQAIQTVMAAESMHVDESQIIVTTGGQQGLDLFARILVDPGDIVLAEGPTYPGVVPVFSSYQADVRHIPLDADGLNPDLVEEMLIELAREGLRPKYLYTIPTFQNPGGTTATRDRRIRLVELAAEYDLLILEDNPYSMLRFDGEEMPTLYSLDTNDRVVYLGTFSKIFAPGIRLGWLAAPPPILARINLVKQAADLCSSPFSQQLVHEFFVSDAWRTYIATVTDVYRGRRDAMLDALSTYFPSSATWTRPDGGLFLWARLPSLINTQDLLASALRQNVAFVPGGAAYLDGSGQSSMRLNFSAVPEASITEGIRRIGSAIHEAPELAEHLGVTQ